VRPLTRELLLLFENRDRYGNRAKSECDHRIFIGLNKYNY